MDYFNKNALNANCRTLNALNLRVCTTKLTFKSSLLSRNKTKKNKMKKLYILFSIAILFFSNVSFASFPPNTCDAQFTVAITGFSVNAVPVMTGDSSISNLWSFGDGTSSAVSSPTHTYATCGTYTISHIIQVNNPNGVLTCADSTVQTVTILCTTPCNLTASFTSSNIAGAATNVLAFVNTTISFAPGDSIRWTFGDGTVSYDVNPTHTFANYGTYNVCLRIVRNLNIPGAPPCVSEVCHTVTLTATNPCNITAAFSTQANPSQSNSFVFTNLSTPTSTANSASWTFGDGSGGTGNTVTHVYSQSGTYIVCLHITVNNTCTRDTCHTITVTVPNPTPCNVHAGFTTTYVNNQLNVVQCINSTTLDSGTVVYSVWNFGDGTAVVNTSGLSNPTHTYTASGLYNICLKVISVVPGTTTATCVDSICHQIQVQVPNPTPCNLNPNFTAQVSPTQNNVFVFTNTSTPLNTAASVSWDFGDSTFGSGFTATHSYLHSGTYTVCMHIAISNTCIRDTCITITVTGTTPAPCNLVANYTWQISQNASSPTVVNFINTSIAAAATDSITWTFGDGSISHDTNPIHTFANYGTYNVCLRVRRNPTAAGTTACISEICHTVILTAPNPCNLVANFSWQSNPTQPNVIVFTNTSMPMNTAASVTWSFGDSTTGTGYTATHSYVHTGTYLVCIHVAINNTCIRDTCITVTVTGTNPPPCNLVADFTWQSSPNTTNANVVHFINTTNSATATDSLTWTFGDGTASHDLNPVHTFANAGTYIVCLRVVRILNTPGSTPCVSEVCHNVIVNVPTSINCDSVHVSYTYVRDAFMSNKIYFVTVANYPVTQEVWTITALNTTNAATVTLNQYNPAYIFSQVGNYVVCLRAVTAGGCIKEACDTISIGSIATQCELIPYPNPAHTQVSVNAVLPASSNIYAYVYNAQNVLVSAQTQAGATGNNIMTFNVSNLTAGFYFIRLYYGNQVCISRFQKL